MNFSSTTITIRRGETYTKEIPAGLKKDGDGNSWSEFSPCIYATATLNPATYTWIVLTKKADNKSYVLTIKPELSSTFALNYDLAKAYGEA
jgi:hypothetical protein